MVLEGFCKDLSNSNDSILEKDSTTAEFDQRQALDWFAYAVSTLVDKSAGKDNNWDVYGVEDTLHQ